MNVGPIPSSEELVNIYNRFQSKTADLSLFLQSYQWCRFDPRLGELLIRYLDENWSLINPMELAPKISRHRWPQVFGVLCSHVSLLTMKNRRKAFHCWVDCCLSSVPVLKKEWSIFFIGIFSFGGKLQKSEAFEGITLYSKWGYFGKTPMIEITKNNINSHSTLISLNHRKQKLAELFLLKKRIRVSDYRSYLEYKISKRAAQLDLQKWAKKSGHTQGATYSKR